MCMHVPKAGDEVLPAPVDDGGTSRDLHRRHLPNAPDAVSGDDYGHARLRRPLLHVDYGDAGEGERLGEGSAG